jgi:DNA-binding transcriptional MerR regulator/methylmalonyl-CoA mutase cobalamin-binding subunit
MTNHSIGATARRTGLTPAVIRVWESRYGAVEPQRTESGQRRFSEDDVRRLEMLKALTDAGHRIGLIGSSSDAELEQLLQALRGPSLRLIGGDPSLEGALAAVAALDREGFRRSLDEASRVMSRIALLDRFLGPLMQEVGERSASGDLRMVHEHLATAEVRGFLDGIVSAFPPSPGAPAMVVGTPAWQHHELGALLVTASARAEGWRVTYLGPNLPAAELASAAVEIDARVVVLSLTFVEDRGHLLGELRTLRGLLPDGTELLVGGRSAAEISEELVELGALRGEALPDLRRELERLRTARRAG